MPPLSFSGSEAMSPSTSRNSASSFTLRIDRNHEWDVFSVQKALQQALLEYVNDSLNIGQKSANGTPWQCEPKSIRLIRL